jgi:hypothetical protein
MRDAIQDRIKAGALDEVKTFIAALAHENDLTDIAAAAIALLYESGTEDTEETEVAERRDTEGRRPSHGGPRRAPRLSARCSDGRRPDRRDQDSRRGHDAPRGRDDRAATTGRGAGRANPAGRRQFFAWARAARPAFARRSGRRRDRRRGQKMNSREIGAFRIETGTRSSKCRRPWPTPSSAR